MRLYRIELYKLFHKRIFITGMLAAIGLMMLYFWFVEVESEISVVEGHAYSGYEAVQINRKITEEFKGAITNEKINQIIERYGLPMKLEENMPGWRDGNYLNDFITRYFTNGSWERRTLPTETYTLEKTELGKIYAEIGASPCLVYTTGWKTFVDMLQFGLVLGSVLVICGISVVFAEEDQTKMLPLIFTTEEGRNRDISAKILASFTLTFLILIVIVLIDLILCGIVYGLDGYGSVSGMVLSEEMFSAVYKIPFSKYLCILLVLAFFALLSLCAVTLCISAHQNSSFAAVVMSFVCWGLPVLLRMFFGGIMWVIVDSTPVFLIMRGTLSDIYIMWYIILTINIFISGVCFVKGILYYKNKAGGMKIFRWHKTEKGS